MAPIHRTNPNAMKIPNGIDRKVTRNSQRVSGTTTEGSAQTNSVLRHDPLAGASTLFTS
jgi:hypothetical protein